MEVHLKIVATLLLILSLAHIFFPVYFKWKEDLKPISLINREMMWIHTLFIAITLLLMSILCFMVPRDLIYTALGKFICLGLGIFWLLRLLIQFVGYSVVLWKGKKFETAIHCLFTVLWVYFSWVFMKIYFQSV